MGNGTNSVPGLTYLPKSQPRHCTFCLLTPTGVWRIFLHPQQPTEGKGPRWDHKLAPVLQPPTGFHLDTLCEEAGGPQALLTAQGVQAVQHVAQLQGHQQLFGAPQVLAMLLLTQPQFLLQLWFQPPHVHVLPTELHIP